MEPEFILPITALSAAALGAVMLAMTLNLALHRRGHQISHGDGDDARFAKRLRGHKNAVEQIPISLILLALAEAIGSAPTLVWIIAGSLLLGRCLHGLQFWTKAVPFNCRPIGVVLTSLAQILAIAAIITGLI